MSEEATRFSVIASSATAAHSNLTPALPFLPLHDPSWQLADDTL